MEGTVRTDGFIDQYEVMQISPNAQPETIQRVYRMLAQMYHPDNSETGNVEIFETVLEAYRILSDPERRAAYDVEHRAVASVQWKIFDQSQSVQGVDGEKSKRLGILSLLYNKRLHEPDKPVLTLVDFEQLLGCPREHLELSLWYLREAGRIQRGDSGRYALTFKGLEYLEENMGHPGRSSELKLLSAPRAAAHAGA
jgi:curved DNA-binding protein CbpA